MTPSLPRAVVFDWDNTLVDSWDAIAEAVNFARARFGLQVWNRDEILRHCTRSARESFPDWFGEKWPEAWEVYYTNFEKVRERLGIHETRGGTELLKWLKAREIPALVVSNKSGDHLRQECALLGWNQYLAAVVGAGDAPQDKPAREHVDKALSLARIQSGPNIWFIGDSEIDVICARNAGCMPMLIATEEKAKSLGVDIFFPDCQAILERLKALR